MKTIFLPIPLAWLQPFDFPHKLGICARLFERILARHGICYVQTAAGIPWKLDLNNTTHRWIVYGKYDPSFLNWAHRFLPPNGVVVDSGANIGQMLLYLAQWVPQGRVLAFEPGTEQASWLEECLTVNTALPVEVIRRGLGASADQARLQNLGEAHIHGAWSMVSETEGEPIEIVRLADELASRSIEKVDLWKLDVQYYELPALKGAQELLEEQRIKAIYVEMWGEERHQILDYLSNFGYRCYLFDSWGKLYPTSQVPDQSDGLFLPK